jgi:hypothetical protein
MPEPLLATAFDLEKDKSLKKQFSATCLQQTVQAGVAGPSLQSCHPLLLPPRQTKAFTP